VKSGRWWAILLVLFVAALIARRNILAVFVFMLALATLASELWGRYCLSNVSYRRRLAHRHIAYGEETTLALEFVNAKPLPLAWLLVQDQFPDQLRLLTAQRRSHIVRSQHWLVSLLSLRWYEKVTRTHRIVGDHRGFFQFGPAEISSGDVFGLQRRQTTDTTIDTLIVYPKIVPVDLLGLPASRPLGDWLARRRVAEDPLRFAYVRDYTPGDNPRHIHWKASARVGGLQTKVFDPTDTLSLVLAVDVQTTPQAYDYIPEYLEYLVSAAASLAVHALDQRYMVGRYANAVGRTAQGWVQIEPGRDPQQLARLLESLADLGPFRRIPFVEMLASIQPLLPYGATVAALTSGPTEALYEALLALEESGHRACLLTVEDDPPNVPEALTHYHLGGRDAWRRLETLELG